MICFLIIFSFFVSQGCVVHRHFLRKHDPVRVKSDLSLSKLERANLLRRSEDYLGALVKYREVIASSRDSNEAALAKIGGAECLLKIKKYPAALSILEPIPLEVKVATDARQLALAGEILLHIGRTKEAEIYLEIAVGSLELESMLEKNNIATVSDVSKGGVVGDRVRGGVEIDDIEIESWIPAMVINLGCAYLKNDKPEYALLMYEFASYLYQKRGDHILAIRSMRMHDDLVSVIRQYEPFKPIPIAKGFSSGRF
ncbi:MAG: hypothetical protein LBB88_08075 [Planctomycetaceae bacterium]|nr:hypothetical protein [Planctomycetaceae bacterium]